MWNYVDKATLQKNIVFIAKNLYEPSSDWKWTAHLTRITESKSRETNIKTIILLQPLIIQTSMQLNELSKIWHKIIHKWGMLNNWYVKQLIDCEFSSLLILSM